MTTTTNDDNNITPRNVTAASPAPKVAMVESSKAPPAVVLVSKNKLCTSNTVSPETTAPAPTTSGTSPDRNVITVATAVHADDLAEEVLSSMIDLVVPNVAMPAMMQPFHVLATLEPMLADAMFREGTSLPALDDVDFGHFFAHCTGQWLSSAESVAFWRAWLQQHALHQRVYRHLRVTLQAVPMRFANASWAFPVPPPHAVELCSVAQQFLVEQFASTQVKFLDIKALGTNQHTGCTAVLGESLAQGQTVDALLTAILGIDSGGQGEAAQVMSQAFRPALTTAHTMIPDVLPMQLWKMYQTRHIQPGDVLVVTSALVAHCVRDVLGMSHLDYAATLFSGRVLVLLFCPSAPFDDVVLSFWCHLNVALAHYGKVPSDQDAVAVMHAIFKELDCAQILGQLYTKHFVSSDVAKV